MVGLALGLAIFAIGPVRADSGSRAIWLVCDANKNYVEVRLFILWNEDLDAYLANHPSGIAEDGTKQTTVFEDTDRSYYRECLAGNRRVEVSVDQMDTLKITENKKPVAVKKIDYVWFAGGQEYVLKSSALSKWMECTGGIDGSVEPPLECRGLTNSETTNSEDIRANWK
jgi:hypothetical protein